MIQPYGRTTALQRDIMTRLVAIGIPPVWRGEFSNTISSWAVNSGPEWTIQRLKSLKVDLIRSQTDLPPLTQWVKKNRSGSFSGSIGSLFSWAKKSEKNFNRVLQAFMAYSIFILPAPTLSQLDKFEKAVSSDHVPIDPNFMSNFCSIAQRFTGSIKIDRSGNTGQSLLFYRGSSSKTRPRMHWEGGRKLQSENPLHNVQYFNIIPHAALYHAFKDLYDPVIWPSQDMTTRYLEFPNEPIDPSTIAGGNIGLIQEPGGKLRSVANPYIVHQLALKPFGNALYKLAKELPWDCTHDQSLPLHTLQDHLSSNGTVHSVDLSSATDLFPLEIQIQLMKSLFGDVPDIQLTEILSRSQWKYGKGTISWKKGQPLGLYPSFGMFTVTHGMLIWYLNKCRHDNMFFVVGDDVVILDDELHHRYTNLLREWEVPYSKDKSISSNKICEFAGKIITSENVFSQLKWRQMSDSNFVDICRLLGPRSYMLLRPRQKKVFKIIEHLITPFGLGFNPQGFSLEDRVRATEELLTDCRLSSSLMGLHSVISKNVYGHTFGFKHKLDPLEIGKLLDVIETFDKKVRSIIQVVTGFRPDIRRVPPSSLTGYSTVPAMLDKVDLPPALTRPSRTTQLDHYEEILGIQ